MLFSQIHPLLVHFPVALFTSGVLFEIYGRLRGEKVVEVAGWFNLRLGFWFALVTATVGFLGVLSLEVKPAFKSFLSFHILSAFSTLLIFGGAILCYRWRERKWAWAVYHVLLMVGLTTILTTGYYGGELVHRFGVSTLQPAD